MEKIKKIICPSCNAEYEDTLPKCPYCDLINYKGAEKEYLNKLEDVREDMGELAYVPESEAKAELKKQGHLIRKIVIVVVIVLGLLFSIPHVLEFLANVGEPPEKEQFLWQMENFPKYDELYEAGEYDELAKVLNDALLGEYSIWDYEHRAFAFAYGDIATAKEAMAKIDSGEDTSEYIYTTLLYRQVDLILQWEREDELSEEEREILKPLKEDVVEDYYTRWQMSEEEHAELIKIAEDNYYVLPYDEAEKFVKKWLKNRK